MARVVYSGLVTEIKRSIGGTTFQSNAYGYTIKNKPRIKKPKTALQQRSKIYMAAAAQAWRALGSTGRANWDAWAASNPQYAKNNPSAVLSGYAVFVRVNQQKFLESGDISDFVASPSYTIYPVDSVAFQLELSGGALTLGFLWTIGDNHNEANIYISQPFKPSVNFIGSRTRYVATIPTTFNVEDITDGYIGAYGVLPEDGDRVFVQNVQYDPDNGIVYARQSAVVEVAEV